MGIDMELEGLDEVLAMLDRVEDKQVIKAADEGLQDGLQAIRAEARENCPKDTRKLEQSIFTRTSIKDGELVGEVVAGAEYAVFVEMGTGPRGEESHAGVDPERLARTTYSPKGWSFKGRDGKWHGTRGQPARPFLYPALKANQGGVFRRIARAVIRAVKGDGGE